MVFPDTQRRCVCAAVEVWQSVGPGCKRFAAPPGSAARTDEANKERKYESYCTRVDDGGGWRGGDGADRGGRAVAPRHELGPGTGQGRARRRLRRGDRFVPDDREL